MTTTIGSLDLTSANSLYNDATQYFWFESDSTATYGAGVHITLSPSATFMSNPTGQNILINTDGISIRNGLLPMMTLDNNSLDFNVVNTVKNTFTNVASFGSTSRIGKLSSRHTSIKDGGFYAYSGSETDANLFAQLGYGLGNSETGTATAPYYSLGIRKSNSSGNIGNYSVAEGYQNNAKGYASHAEGIYTEAVEKYTHSQNIGTVANSLAQTVIGTYNEIDDDIDDTHHPNYEHAQFGKYAFIVGNGSDEQGLSQVSRSNALTIDWYGRVNAKGYYLNTVDIFNPTLSSVGLSPISSRCTIQSGGIVRLGSWVFVQLCLKVATSLSASSWGLVSGLPTPSTSSTTALSASIQKNTGGNISANVTSAGNIAVQLPSTASAGNVILINGWYISA